MFLFAIFIPVSLFLLSHLAQCARRTHILPPHCVISVLQNTERVAVNTLRLRDDKSKLMVAKNYFRTVCKEDISRVDGVSRDEKLARMILRSYARNISTLAKKTTLLADVSASEEMDCSMDTFSSYVKALEKLLVIQDIRAWFGNPT